ncbi:MAG: tyrosine--tRNA ligase, partial [Saprospiraceae bacterium]|nr:tyrosine--tRNA ligase [Saprospiraceae bacterium]
VLMGRATGRIGDPSGKDQERDLKSAEELDDNLAHQRLQFERLLDFSDLPNKAQMVNNLDFYRSMNVLDFLRDVGKSINISYMLAKDSVKSRLDKGLSFTEFSYQLLQAYDFQCLYQQNDCIIQMGGSDQWGNITSGTEFIRRNLSAKAYAITTPLLTKTDGSKFGKSAEGNIWLDPNLTSPYKFYQFWINTDDIDLPKYLRYFSFKSKTEIEADEELFKNDLQSLKKVLAEEMTIRIHGEEAYASVLKVSELVFGRQVDHLFLESLNRSDWLAVTSEIPSFTLERAEAEKGINVIDFIAESTGIVQSKSDGRRAIQGNALAINKLKIKSLDHMVTEGDFMNNEFMLIENGKKNKYAIQLV